MIQIYRACAKTNISLMKLINLITKDLKENKAKNSKY